MRSYVNLLLCFFFLMRRRPPPSTRTDTLCPSTTLFRSRIAEYAAKAVRRQDKISPPDGEDFGRCAPVVARRYRPCTRASAALNVLRSRQAIVMGPTPPGTGV